MKYKFRAAATVSCWTEIEADSLEEAKEEAEGRELADMCYQPFTSEIDDSWHFDNDGCAFDIALDEED
tara:strand:- start:5390 stop:5593 length:204 start_codon:yes stop_codon:yes gene_type:complete